MKKMTGVFLAVLFMAAGCGSFEGGIFNDPDVLSAFTEGFASNNSESTAVTITTFTFTNESSYRVTFVAGISSFELAAGNTIPVAVASSFDTLVYSPENTVAYEVSGTTVRFFDR